MACEYMRAPQQTEAERRAEIAASLAELEQALLSGKVSIGISTTGAVVFQSWGDERAGVTDACAYQRLSQAGSFALSQAVATAQAQTGRVVSVAQVAAGVHSHDGGKTWGTH